MKADLMVNWYNMKIFKNVILCQESIMTRSNIFVNNVFMWK